VTGEDQPLKLALDQNFPTSLVNAIVDFLPRDIQVASVHRIDRRLSDLDDRPLFLALHHLGWGGLVTNNYKMLDIATEVAAIVRTQAVVVAVEGLGHDPLRAAGALLLELPGLRGRLVANRSNVFRLAYRRRPPENGRTYLERIADRQGRSEDDLWREVLVTQEEFEAARLPN
jgi:hypothetical protein